MKGVFIMKGINMLRRIWSGAVQGVNALPVQIEVHKESGLPKFVVVGLPDKAVKESIDRVFAAAMNSGFRRPRGRFVINLAPADLPKEGASFDLPIALGLIAVDFEIIDQSKLDDYFIAGELSLDGDLRPIKGVLPLALRAKASGKKGLIVPRENGPEASMVDGLEVYPVNNLVEAFKILMGETVESVSVSEKQEAFFPEDEKFAGDFSDVHGQESVKRAIEIAATGGHNLLMVGTPGSGKTMLAQRIPSILPRMSKVESMETTKIYSVAGKLGAKQSVISRRPFRAPHHTISNAGLCGGGTNPKPGEMSLAHNGILFLDELPEFRRQALELMRQPLEDGYITISRARGSIDFPSRFMLIASMNPCPCGHTNDPNRECKCSPTQTQRYHSKISGPLLDRIDIQIEVAPVKNRQLGDGIRSESSCKVAKRVSKGRSVQKERFSKTTAVMCNAHMGSKELREFCEISGQLKALLEKASHNLGLSARGYTKVMKVARTIADLDGSINLSSKHLTEAIQYRSVERTLLS